MLDVSAQVVREDEARRRFAAARVARPATSDAAAHPHIVPLVFAVDANRIYTCVDHKPKSTTALRRLRNVSVNPLVSLLVDHYHEDWAGLWWVRADGIGRVLEGMSDESAWALDLLVARYPQYESARPDGPVLAVDVARWSDWEASASGVRPKSQVDPNSGSQHHLGAGTGAATPIEGDR